MKITEERVKEIHLSHDLSKFPLSELHEVDAWIKNYALTQLRIRLRDGGIQEALVDYILVMARSSMGSVETNNLLIALNCYPSWMS